MVVNGVPSRNMRRFYRNAHGELVYRLPDVPSLYRLCFHGKGKQRGKKCHAVGEEVENIVERFVSLRIRRFPSTATCIITE